MKFLFLLAVTALAQQRGHQGQGRPMQQGGRPQQGQGRPMQNRQPSLDGFYNQWLDDERVPIDEAANIAYDWIDDEPMDYDMFADQYFPPQKYEDLDVDGDGVLWFQELMDYSKHMAQDPYFGQDISDEEHQRVVEDMVRKSNPSGLPYTTTKQFADWRAQEAFDHYDQDSNGYVSNDEIINQLFDPTVVDNMRWMKQNPGPKHETTMENVLQHPMNVMGMCDNPAGDWYYDDYYYDDYYYGNRYGDYYEDDYYYDGDYYGYYYGEDFDYYGYYYGEYDDYYLDDYMYGGYGGRYNDYGMYGGYGGYQDYGYGGPGGYGDYGYGGFGYFGRRRRRAFGAGEIAETGCHALTGGSSWCEHAGTATDCLTGNYVGCATGVGSALWDAF